MGRQTPSQTVGPYFHYGLTWKGGADLTGGAGDLGARMDLIPPGHYVLNPGGGVRRPVRGEPVEIAGVVRDGDGQPVPDAMVEIWQADADGRYAPDGGPGGFIGFGRSATGKDGGFIFRTVKPGRVPGPGGRLQAPHVAIGVFGRGLLRRLATRLYFADDPATAGDPILALVPADRRTTLLARPEGPGRYRFDILLQGPGETVFFDL
ncbi:MAG TPA: protocatechuate 3,4-dioxygenase subunit alpha [Azospirillaceae bacterium]|nr:protocatechuate 3,4-dioxygenase subunit alpha [Azospirillaceae bacterium]